MCRGFRIIHQLGTNIYIAKLTAKEYAEIGIVVIRLYSARERVLYTTICTIPNVVRCIGYTNIYQILEYTDASLQDTDIRGLSTLFGGGIRTFQRSLLIQVLCTYQLLIRRYGFTHGDLELRNILVKKSVEETQSLLIYIFGDIAFVVKTHGILFLLSDFGKSSLWSTPTEQQTQIRTDILRFLYVLGQIMVSGTGSGRVSGTSNVTRVTASRDLPLKLLLGWVLTRPLEATKERIAKWKRLEARGRATLLQA